MAKGDKGRTVYRQTFDSIDAFAKVAVKHRKDSSFTPGFSGVETWEEALTLARDGWSKGIPEIEALAESAISTVRQELESVAFQANWDVSGCEVDVARYLTGVPENMIDYDIVPSTRYGRVISLCASFSASSAISTEAFRKRGTAIVAFALALNTLGYACELWADLSATLDESITHQRVLVKGANDELDPARIMFAYSHPAMLRVLGFGAYHEFPPKVSSVIARECYGLPRDAEEDLPEGTIYLPCLRSNSDVPNADVALRQYLTSLGILD